MLATDANLLKQASFIDAVVRGHVNGLAICQYPSWRSNELTNVTINMPNH
nr:hypothetical protein [Brevibacillus laterosporus]